MEKYPQTVEELVNDIDIKELEYVADIVVNGQKKYGIGLRGSVTVDGNEHSVLGSVVLNHSNGEPVYCEGTSFVAYSDIASGDGENLLEGAEAVEAMRRIYERTQGESNPFVGRSEVQIAEDAK